MMACLEMREPVEVQLKKVLAELHDPILVEMVGADTTEAHAFDTLHEDPRWNYGRTIVHELTLTLKIRHTETIR